MQPYKILIVDDEPDIRKVINVLLCSEGYLTVEAKNGADALKIIETNPDFDLIILDIMMPVMDGIEACAKIRQFSNIPTLFLSAKTTDEDKLTAYKNGGDDFLVKPFAKNELLLKINSMIRRYRVYSDNKTRGSGITIDYNTQTVKKGDTSIILTDTEFSIFAYFYEHKGTPVDLKTLYSAVWHEQYLPNSSNTIMVHILNLRRKLEDDTAHPTIIKTVWGKGYQFD